MERRTDGSIRLFLALCCWAFGTIGLLAVSLWAWLLKDGLGPDSVESHGWRALERFWAGAGWALLAPTVLIIAGILLYLSDRRRATY